MSTELAIRDGQSAFDSKQIAALEQLGVAGASRADQAIFFHQCVRTGLDPFVKQIYMIGRRTNENGKWVVKQTIQTGIDGFRLIARRAADKRSESIEYEDTLWCGEDGDWRDVWLAKEPPQAAKVTLLRDGHRVSAVALLSEYIQRKSNGEPNSQWATRPAHMLAKCAEALALRKAFPQDLSGLYTEDETGIEPVDGPAAVEGGGTQRMSRAGRVAQPADPAEPTEEVIAEMNAEASADEPTELFPDPEEQS